MNIKKKIKEIVLAIIVIVFSFSIPLGFAFLANWFISVFLPRKIEENIIKGALFGVGFLVVIWWICFKIWRIEKKVQEEVNLVREIMEANPHLNDEELIDKVEEEFLKRNPKTWEIVNSGKREFLREWIRKRIQEIRKIKEELSKFKASFF